MQEVSLYIPCFNAAETIHLCLEAVFKQKYPLKGVLVVDDGSTDETVDIAAKYPVKIIRHKKIMVRFEKNLFYHMFISKAIVYA